LKNTKASLKLLELASFFFCGWGVGRGGREGLTFLLSH